MASSTSPPPGFLQCRWQRPASPVFVSSALQGGNEHVSGLGISSSSFGEASVGGAGPATGEAAAMDRGRIQDRLVWQEAGPSKKSLWRDRKERQRAAAPYGRKAVAEEMAGRCFNYFRKGHMKWEYTFEQVCTRCGEEGHETRACSQRRSHASEEDLRRRALEKLDVRDAQERRSPCRQGASGPALRQRAQGRGWVARQVTPPPPPHHLRLPRSCRPWRPGCRCAGPGPFFADGLGVGGRATCTIVCGEAHGDHEQT
jgi:hypothetical protein